MKAGKKILKKLNSRIARYEAMNTKGDRGFRKPGSQNLRKGN